MVWEELDEELLFTAVEAKTYEDVMKCMGQKFVEAGYCYETFVNALIEREKEFPTGLDINGIGVAMPHTSATYVKAPATGIGILKQPVTFLHMGTDDQEVSVQVIFMLAVSDPNAHIEKIQSILSVIQDKEVLEKLIQAKTKQEMILCIQEKEMASC